MGRAARSIQCYQVHENNEFTGENLQVQHTFLTMAWRVVCELLLLSKFVSLSVIPANRKLNELSSVPEEAESQRTKRSLGYSYYDDDDDDVEVIEHWESLCDASPQITPLAKESHNGQLIFKLAPHLSERGNIDYIQSVTEFKCVQQTVKHELDVYNADNETVLFEKVFFINSG